MIADEARVQAIERLYRADYRRFLRVSLAILRDEQLAHDAVQEGFARALKQRGSYRGNGEIDGWVWRIVVNAALAARRRSVRAAELTTASEAWPGETASDESGVRQWVATLPERQRLAVFLRYYADLDYAGIATALDVEVGTVSATLAAAHETLRRSLEEVSHVRP